MESFIQTAQHLRSYAGERRGRNHRRREQIPGVGTPRIPGYVTQTPVYTCWVDKGVRVSEKQPKLKGGGREDGRSGGDGIGEGDEDL